MGYTVTTVSYDKIKLNETNLVASVLQNISILLRTKKGTCPLYRQFGISDRYLDRPTNAAPPILYAEIKEAVEEYEPRARVENISFAIDPARPGVLIPSVEVTIIAET